MKTLITCHANADFDAFSSLIAARLLYPNAILLFPGTQEKNLQRYIEEVATKHYSFISPKELEIEGISRVVVVDTRQRSRLEHIEILFDKEGIEFTAWDHHPASTNDIQVDTLHYEEVGATASLLTHEILQDGKELSSQDASLLSLGIHADTGSFTYSSTTQLDFRAISLLWKFHVETSYFKQYLTKELTPEHVKALNDLLETAEVHTIAEDNIVIAQATSDVYIHDFSLLSPLLMEMLPSQAFFALAMMGEKIQILARSSKKSINVGSICKVFGGGGHDYAASASVKNMTLLELKDSLLQEIYLQQNPHKTAQHLLSAPVISLKEEMSMGQASTLMTRYGMKAMPILNKDKICQGWISQEQAARASALNPLMMRSSVSLYMHRIFKVVSPKASLQELMDIIIGEKQRLVPVVKCDELHPSQEKLQTLPVVGVITRTDIIRLFSDEHAYIPVPNKSTDQKERNLSKVLLDKLDKDCIEVLKIAGDLAQELGCQLSVVGGFVRDLFLEKRVKDWSELDIDFVVEGDGVAFAYALASKLNGKIKQFSPYMTATILYNYKDKMECKIDIATARLEYYEYPAALPTVEVSSLKMDLFRRDFSINSMAIRLNPSSYGVLVDFFNGRQDMRKKKINMLHTLSFVEDPTRILRAIRFEQRYSFEIGQQCGKLMQNAIDIDLIDKLSGKRITREIELLLKEENLFAIVQRMEDFNLLYAIHPLLKLEKDKEDFIASLFDVLDWHKKLYLNEKIDIFLLLLIGLTRSALASDIEEIAVRFALSKKRTTFLLDLRSSIIHLSDKLAYWLRKEETPSKLYHLLKKMPIEASLYSIARTSDESLKKALTQYVYDWRNEKADINGNDLENMKVPQGRLYSTLLTLALDAKLDNIAPTRDEQLKLVEEAFLNMS